MTSPRPAVIEYRIFSRFMTVFLVTVSAALLLFVVGMPISLGRSLTLECSRAEQTCAVTTRYPLFGTSKRAHSLGDLGSPALTSPSSGQGAGISFKTSFGPRFAGDCLHAEACVHAKAALDAFFADPRDPSVSAPLETPIVAWKIAAVTGVGLLVFAFVARRSLAWIQVARIVVDPSTRSVRVERRQWLWRTYARSFEQDVVSYAFVREEMRAGAVFVGGLGSSRRMPHFTASLALRTGENVDLLDRWSPTRTPHDRAATAINAALGAAAPS